MERLIDADNAWHDARTPPAPQQRQPAHQQPGRPYRDHDSDEYPVYGGQHGKRRKRGGFLEDLFD